MVIVVMAAIVHVETHAQEDVIICALADVLVHV